MHGSEKAHGVQRPGKTKEEQGSSSPKDWIPESGGGGGGREETGARTHSFNMSYRGASNPQAVFRRQGSAIFLSRAGW